MKYILFILYVLMSGAGLIVLKSGADKMALSAVGGILNVQISFKTGIGMILYLGSFILMLIVLPKFDISYLYPVASGLIFIIVSLASYFILKEKIDFFHLVGLLFILVGIIIMNLKFSKN